MLLLWYSQGMINNHRCCQCDKDWIDHMIKFELYHKHNVDDTEHSENNGNANELDSDSSVLLRQQINDMIKIYMPQVMHVNVGDDRTIDIPLDGASIEFSQGINILIGKYLYSKAYGCSFALPLFSLC